MVDALTVALDRLATLPKTSIRDGSSSGRFVVDWLDVVAAEIDIRTALKTSVLGCEHNRATPCVDRNGSCGTHLSPWPIYEEALL